MENVQTNEIEFNNQYQIKLTNVIEQCKEINFNKLKQDIYVGMTKSFMINNKPDYLQFIYSNMHQLANDDLRSLMNIVIDKVLKPFLFIRKSLCRKKVSSDELVFIFVLFINIMQKDNVEGINNRLNKTFNHIFELWPKLIGSKNEIFDKKRQVKIEITDKVSDEKKHVKNEITIETIFKHYRIKLNVIELSKIEHPNLPLKQSEVRNLIAHGNYEIKKEVNYDFVRFYINQNIYNTVIKSNCRMGIDVSKDFYLDVYVLVFLEIIKTKMETLYYELIKLAKDLFKILEATQFNNV